MKKKLIALVGAALMLSASFIYADITSDEIKLSGTKEGDVYISEIKGEYSVTSDTTIKEVVVKLGETEIDKSKFEDVQTAAKEFTISEEDLLAEEKEDSDAYKVLLEVTQTDGTKITKEKEFRANVSIPEYILEGVKAEGYYNEEKEFTVFLKDGKKTGIDFNLEYKRGDEVLFSGKVEKEKKLTLDVPGTYTLKSSYTDSIGNVGTLDTFIIIDDEAPALSDITFEGQSLNNIYSDDTTVKTTLTDNEGVKALKKVEIFLDDEEEAYLTEKEFKKEKENNEENVESEEAEEDKTFDVEFVIEKKWLEKHIKEDNKYTVKIVATDKAGNVKEKTKTFLADCETPEIAVEGIKDGDILKKTPTLEMTATDNHMTGLSVHYVVKNTGDLVEEKTVKASVAAFAGFTEDGIYSIEVNAIDKAGNESKVKSFSFIKDATAPVKGVFSVEGDIRTGYETYYFEDENSTIDITAKFADVLSGINKASVKVNDKTIKEETYDRAESADMSISLAKDWFEENLTNNNKYVVAYEVIDAAGNKYTEKYNLKADVDAPTVEFTGIKEGKFTNEEIIDITVGTYDNVVKTCKTVLTIKRDGTDYDVVEISGKDFYHYKNFENDGFYELTAVSTDEAGNESDPATLSFTKDTIAPEFTGLNITGSKNVDYAAYNGAVKTQTMFGDNRSGMDEMVLLLGNTQLTQAKYEGQMQANETYEFSKEYLTANPKKNNKYSGKIIIKDRAGNTNVQTYEFKADTIAPKLQMAGIKNGIFTNQTQTVQTVVTDNSANLCKTIITVYKDGKLYDETTVKEPQFAYSGFPKDGHYSVTSITIDEAGNKSNTETVEFTYDTTAPVINVTGAKNNSYTQKSVTAMITVKEKNYKNATFNGRIKRNLEGNAQTDKIKISPDKENYSVKRALSADGTYTITVTGHDKAGNEAKPVTLVFSIDKTNPVVKIEKVKNVYGYSSKVTPIVSYKDSFLKDVTISLGRSDGKKFEGVTFKDSQSKYTGTRAYTDFKSVKANDGVYTLTCVVTDRAGNSARAFETFTVNRYGSVFALSDEAKEYEAKYVQNVNTSFNILERNYSVLEKGEATVTRDGATLATNIDAMINKQPKDGARYEYRYSFDREIFEDEGIYTIDIKSKDIADNINEYSKDNDIYKLCVDRTPPTISISGIKAGGSYKDGGIQVNVDDSMKLEQYVVMSNDEVLYSSTEDEPIKNSAAVRLPSGIKQTVTVEAVDAAGNTNSEVIENVTVSESFFVRLFSNTLVKIMFAIILLGIIGVIVYRIIRKRKEY